MLLLFIIIILLYLVRLDVSWKIGDEVAFNEKSTKAF